MTIARRYQLLFVIFVVFGAFYPTLFAGINSIDDWQMFANLEKLAEAPLWQLFLPTSGFYYRPLLMTTFVLDFRLWGSEPSFYHLGNILIHAGNACLVYWLVQSLVQKIEGDSDPGYWPLLTALIFSVHPLVTESVAWISGRTDLLGAFFVLCCTLAIVRIAAKKSLIYVFVALVSMSCAIMAKEIMVFFIPAGAFLLWRLCPCEDSAWRKRSVFLFAGPFFLAGSLYFCWRLFLYGQTGAMANFIHRYDYDLLNSVRVFFKATGFYFKKIFLPLPLNFAIVSASDHYVWVGVLAVIAFFVLIGRKRLYFSLMVVGLFMILPGTLIALTNIAWTPLAERYAYLATIFMVIGCLLGLRTLVTDRGHSVVAFSAAFLLLPMTMATVQRNVVWQDNARLYADTKIQSPSFNIAYNQEAVALIDQGRLTAAEKLLNEGKGLPETSPLLYINQARIYLMREQVVEAREEILQICPDKESCFLEALKMLAKVDEIGRLKGHRVEIGELLDTYGILARRSPDPFYKYKYGQLLYRNEQKTEALEVFEKVVGKADPQAFYRPAAEKYVSRLQAELNR